MNDAGERVHVEDALDGDSAAITGALEEAAGQIASLLADAESAAESIRQRAYIEGRASGEREGRATARLEVAGELQLLQSVGRQAAAAHDSIMRSTEAELIELTAEAARAVLGEAVARDPELVTTSVRRALDRATSMNVLRVRVHPDDASIVSAYLAQTPAPGGGTWEVSPEGAITIGGCVIDIDGGEIDARLDVQLETVMSALRALVPDAPAVDGGAADIEEQLRAA